MYAEAKGLIQFVWFGRRAASNGQLERGTYSITSKIKSRPSSYSIIDVAELAGLLLPGGEAYD